MSELTSETVAGLAKTQGVTLGADAAASVASVLAAAVAALPKAVAGIPFEAEPASFVAALRAPKEGA